MGSEGYKRMLRSWDVEIAEGAVERLGAPALLRRAQRAGQRRLLALVTARPPLHRAARGAAALARRVRRAGGGRS